jgi:homocysteine S-methyltransferase
MDFLDQLQTTILPGDGAMGTQLIEMGVAPDRCFEELCVSAPGMVCGVHQQYLAAGARVIRTNSFGANAVRLERFGFENRVNEINWSAAKLAKSCTRGKNARVAGSVGPLGIGADEACKRGVDREAVFREQLGALLDGGVDLIFFETFLNLDELALALRAKQSLHHCPAACSMACAPDGRLPSGLPVAGAFAKLRALDAEIVGVNCVNGPAAMARLVATLSIDGLFSAYPNAGLPISHEGRLVYETTPEQFALAAQAMAAQGARLIGGCCGIGPRHIEAMTEALAGLQPPPLKEQALTSRPH